MEDQFNKLQQPNHAGGHDINLTRAEFLAGLTEAGVDRFEKLTGLRPLLVPVELDGSLPLDGIPPAPRHPLCGEDSAREECQSSWRSHLTELALRPAVHWHRCRFARLCAIVPVVWHRRCLAANRLVGPADFDEQKFEQYVELLDVLIDNYLVHNGSKLLPALAINGSAEANGEGEETAVAEFHPREPNHPQVRKALAYIDQHLTDPDMSVASIAAMMNMNATYLAHIFVDQVGMRMSRYIASARIELARKLLRTTNWQIKRVAFECGYANPDWFCQVFRTQTGVTPSAFRRDAGSA